MRKYFAFFIIVVTAISGIHALLTGKTLAEFLLECLIRLFQSCAFLIAAGIVIALIMFVVGSIILLTGIHKDINADPGTISRTIRQSMKDEYGWRRLLGSYRTIMAPMKKVCGNVWDSKLLDFYGTMLRRIKKKMAQYWPPRFGPNPDDWRDEE